ncbi:MAG: 4Fe-4S binding protein [Negativicutes bacterium]|nr:4Fe-4S binding protein [Negativicutes bacterium]
MKNMVMARTISQIVFFLLLAVVLVGAFCSVSLGAGAYLTCSLGMLQLTVSSRELIGGVILSGLLLLVLTIAMGRVFCGWICPFGALLDWLQKPLAKLRALTAGRFSWLTRADNRGIKYGVLAGSLVAAGLVKYPAFCAVCPVGTVCRTAGLQGLNIGAETAVLPLIASMETVQKRFWCKALCPIGALLGLASRFSLFKIRLPWNNCAGCNRCEQACSMDNSPRYAGITALKNNSTVLKALIESGMPDALDRPARPEAMPEALRRAVDAANKKLGVNPAECTRCFACAAACPVLINTRVKHPTFHQDGKQQAV